MDLKPVVLVLLLGCGLILISQSPSTAGTKRKPAKPDPALPTVEKVLRAEVAGLIDRRNQLAEALETQPDSPAARWQAGYVRTADAWQPVEQIGQLAMPDEKVRRYQERRREVPRTADGHLELANWCRKNGLADRERAHLTAVLLLVPGEPDTTILARLGLMQIGNQWLSREQICQWQEMNRRAATALKQWGPKLERIADELENSRQQRDAAVQALRKMTTPAVIPAIEYVWCGRDEAAALAAVEVFQSMEGHEASQALARQAVFSKWSPVRQRATESLKSRRFEDFMPALIGLLASPTTSRVTVQLYFFHGYPNGVPDVMRRQGTDGQLVMLVSYILAHETEDQFKVAVMHSVDYRLNEFSQTVWFGEEVYTGFNMRRTDARAQNDEIRADRDEARKREQLVDGINARTEALNRQVIAVLAGATGRDPSPEPGAWWQWWADYTDTQQIGDKRAVIVSEASEVKGDPTITLQRTSCFGAGTPVWIETGLVPIETIQVGDRILAQNIDTGELAYKPVLRTTERPPRELVRVRLADETLVATGGHRFWVSGEGWIKARDLSGQALLHTATGNAPVWSTSKSDPEPTFNLVVADFHSYFVGRTGVLVQDLPLPQPTNCIVPGLARK